MAVFSDGIIITGARVLFCARKAKGSAGAGVRSCCVRLRQNTRPDPRAFLTLAPLRAAATQNA